mmetsp:Transcript_15312/g.50278  ORF Transcript_15312/g.50278 Transcript_15312/m.50278 type:complete len:291 (+) Transcript_15312:4150-5022(+)
MTRTGLRPFTSMNCLKTSGAPPTGAGASSQNVASSVSGSSPVSSRVSPSAPSPCFPVDLSLPSVSPSLAPGSSLNNGSTGASTGAPSPPKCAFRNRKPPNPSVKCDLAKPIQFSEHASGKCSRYKRTDAAKVWSTASVTSFISLSMESAFRRDVDTPRTDRALPNILASSLFSSRVVPESFKSSNFFFSTSSSSSNRNNNVSTPLLQSSKVVNPGTALSKCAAVTSSPTHQTNALDAGNFRNGTANRFAIVAAISICVVRESSHTATTAGIEPVLLPDGVCSVEHSVVAP